MGVTELLFLPMSTSKSPNFLASSLYYFFLQSHNFPVVLSVPWTPSHWLIPRRCYFIAGKPVSDLFPFLVKVAIPVGDSF